MESGIHSSFIPHDTADQGGRERYGDFMYLVMLITGVLFVASIVLGVGVFLYQQFLDTSSKSKLAQLERAKAEFEPALIKELTRLDDRMNVADEILSNHNAVSVFFHVLEQITLTDVSFTSLDFEAADPKNINIKMAGVAGSLNAVALQADIFSKNGVIASPIFSNIDRQLDGIHFGLTARINPSLIRYSQLISSLNGASGDGASSPPSPQNLVPPPVTGQESTSASSDNPSSSFLPSQPIQPPSAGQQ
ncbi:MAG: hypothetical protein Q7S75_01855 [bacterium]|nr:hypothetical protein [bacterium]